MAEETPAPTPSAEPTNGGPGQAGTAPRLRVLSQYVKDLSFENPGLPPAKSQPNIDLGIDVGATAHKDGNNVFEVSIRITANAKSEAAVMFVLDLDYSGLFQLQGFQPENVEAALLIDCPQIIFPYARRVISDVTRDGGFPPLLVDPIDFRNLYVTQKQRQQNADGNEAPQQA